MREEERNIFDEFYRVLRINPDKVIVSGGNASTDLTVADVDRLSAKVYRYLHDRGIGKEDMVNVLLPREPIVFPAILGVWKAGAAVVALDETGAKERIAFIQKDCDCKLVLDRNAWEEIQECEPLEGYEPLDVHAAAFAVYTSGTTGNPKGVLHEFGKLGRIRACASWQGHQMMDYEDRFGFIVPIDFGILFLALIICLMNGTSIYIIPRNVVKNPNLFLGFYLEHQISVCLFPPSLFRMFDDLGPYLKKVILAGEPANGLWREPEKMILWNMYGSSEAGELPAAALLDRPCDIAPIGTPQYDTHLYILDEDGNEVPLGEVGEICHPIPFTRGYFNLPELNEQVFKDGMYHTGDLAKISENGQYQIIGRKGDTIKINGNRVEPAEVEKVIKRVTGLDWVAVKAFVDGDDAFLCAYHMADIDMDVVELQDRLKDVLPQYMLPSYFVKLDTMPVNANGKFERKSLPRPRVDDYKNEYKAPRNDLEKLLCDKMAVILQQQRFGIADDFYLLGGDSLRSMELLAELSLPGLDISDLYAGRTPEKIAALYENKQKESKGTKDLPMQAPLSDIQLYYAEKNDMAKNSTLMNLPFRLHLKEDVDPKRLAAALHKAFQAHPAVCSVIVKDEKGEYIQRYMPQMNPDIPVETVTDQELEKIAKDFVKPFTLDGSPLLRCRLLKGQTKTAVLIDVPHIIIDGEGIRILVDDIYRAYVGEPIRKDYWYELLREPDSSKDRELSESDAEYIRGLCDRGGDNLPIADHPMSSMTEGEVYLDFLFDRKDVANVSGRYGLGQNGFYIAAAALALSKYNATDNVFFEWIWNGRSGTKAMQSVGLLYQEMPASFHIAKNPDILTLLDEVKEQIMFGFAHADVKDWGEVLNIESDKAFMCIIYQRNLYEYHPKDVIDRIEVIPNETAVNENPLDVEILDGRDSFGVLLRYNASMYEEESMQRFARLICEMGEKIIAAVGEGV